MCYHYLFNHLASTGIFSYVNTPRNGKQPLEGGGLPRAQDGGKAASQMRMSQTLSVSILPKEGGMIQTGRNQNETGQEGANGQTVSALKYRRQGSWYG